MTGVYTGKVAESEMLGGIRGSEKFVTSEKSGYLPYHQAIKLAKELQVVDENKGIGPTNPGPRFANDLHAALCEKLGLDDYDNLRYYCALGTELDRYHGIDAFFELDANNHDRPLTVTFDLTLNEHKDEYKADIIIQIDENSLDVESDRDRYNQMIESSADKIYKAFQIALDVNRRQGRLA